MKKGCLCGIGTGPGDPGLLTFEAGEKITGADILVFPNKEKEKCIAYKIAKKAFPEIETKELLFLDFPMTKDKETLEKAWNENGEKILSLIEQGKIDTTPLITHCYKLDDIEEAYHLFENKLDGVIKVAVEY